MNITFEEILIKELQEVLELTDYISDDHEATDRLRRIREKAIAALKHLKSH